MAIVQTIKSGVKKQLINQFATLLSNLSEKNIRALAKIMRQFVWNEGSRKMIDTFISELENNKAFRGLIERVINQTSKSARQKFLKNFFGGYLLTGLEVRMELKKELGYVPPAFAVISPSMRCNLICRGCYAGNYTQKDDLTFEQVDEIITQLKNDFGMSFLVISGGEPFSWQPLLKIAEKHNDMFFLIYTNGTLITKTVAKKLGKLGNMAPAISVEGFETETDDRRGKGVYKRVLAAMDNLKKEGVIFGFSATPTSLNADLIGNDEFLDFYVKKGCLFGWFFQYIPIGLKPDVKLMATPEQRNELRKRVEHSRKTYPIFLGDFWNDGPYVEGCMAGGRLYFHINNKGDIEPCVFCHFSTDNIKDTPLKEALNSKLFRAIRREYPYGDGNLLTPCMIIDNPEVLRKVVKESGAKPTHEGGESIIEDPKIKKHLDEYSKKMKKLAKEPWEKDYKNRNFFEMLKY
ncbi:MAG: radical SAM protein [archaeon]